MSKRKPGKLTSLLVPLEDDEQIALFEWADRHLHLYPELGWMFAINNGLRLRPVQAIRAKRMGTRSGVSDVLLPAPRGGYHGLFIEMKRTVGSTIQPNQRLFANAMSEQGYLVKFCRGWEQAKEEIQAYLGGRCYTRLPLSWELPPGTETVTNALAGLGREVLAGWWLKRVQPEAPRGADDDA